MNSPAQAVTVAQWDFEDGVDGQEFTPAGQPNGSGGSQDLVNGTFMYGFSANTGPKWTSDTANGQGLAMNLETNGTTSDGYVFEGDLINWSPTAWTIETHVLLRDLGGYRTLVGRDGSTQSVPESDFYLQNEGQTGNNNYRINIASVGGTRRILDGAPEGGIQANTWYGVVARSDGSELTMWIDDGFGYEQVAALDITDQSVANNALPGSTLTWTFGRGWFNGGQGDFVNGIMDNVRFSDTALAPQDFIPLEVVTPLALYVDPATGEVGIRNERSTAISFDYYKIESPTDGALRTANYNGTTMTGWNSLSDQGTDAIGAGAGESWDEATGALSANQLVEQFLLGNTTLGPGASVMLGAPVNPSLLLTDDIEFYFAQVGGGLQRATVIYEALPEGFEGDYNGDGMVDVADYTVWRDALGAGATTLTNRGSGLTGPVSGQDYLVWRGAFGNGVPGAAVAPATIPEPAGLLLTLLAFGAAAVRRTR